jgi:hypothetical protein
LHEFDRQNSLLGKLLDLFDHKRQIGAVGVTKVTGGAVIRFHHNRVVSAWMHRKHMRWTKYNANIATLAPGCKNLHLAARTFSSGFRRGLVFSRDKFGHDNPFCLALAFI